MPDINPKVLLVSLNRNQEQSLTLFLCKSLGKQWETVNVLLPDQTTPVTLGRKDCEQFFHQQYLRTFGPEGISRMITQNESLAPERIKELETKLFQTTFPEANNQQNPIQTQYEIHLEKQAEGIDTTGNNQPIIITSLSQATQANQAAKLIQTQLGQTIQGAVDSHLQNYPESYRREVGQQISRQIQTQAISHMTNGELDEVFVKNAVASVTARPLLRAAITNTGTFQASLNQGLKSINEPTRQSLIQASNSLAILQLSIDPSYQNLLTRLTATGNLTPQQAGTVITKLDQYMTRSPDGNPYVISNNLRDALSSLPESVKAKINADNLAAEVSNSFAHRKVGYHPSIIRLTAGLNKHDEFSNICQAAATLYAQGVPSEKLAGEVKEQVQKLENTKTTAVIGKYSAQGRLDDIRNRSVKWAKQKEHEEWLATSHAGLILAPRMRARKAIRESAAGQAWASWGQGVANFKENSALGVVLAPNWRARKALGNWLIKGGKEAAGKTLIQTGFKGIAKYLLKQGLAKIGLAGVSAVASGGIVPIVAGAWFGIKSFYRVFRNSEQRKRVLGFAAATASTILIFLYKFIATHFFTVLGFGSGLAFGPAAPIMAPILGGLGFLFDSVIGGVKGAASAVGSVFSPGSAAAASTVDAAANSLLTAPLPATASTVPIFTALAVPAIGSIFVFMTLSSAFFVPGEGWKKYGSDYISVSKTGSGTTGKIDNKELPRDIEYQVTVYATKTALSNITVIDSPTLEGSKQNLSLPAKTWQIPSLAAGQNWQSERYKLSLDKSYSDSVLTNRVSVSANSPDGSQATSTSYTIFIGTPPAQYQSVTLAYDVINSLNNCSGLQHSGNGVIVNQASWQTAKKCLETSGINSRTISILEGSVNKFNNLQCVGFAQAVSNVSLPPVAWAAEYCNKDIERDWNNLAVGDLVVTNAGPGGHIAVVVRKNGPIIDLAEAIGDYGLVQLRTNMSVDALKAIPYCGFFKGK